VKSPLVHAGIVTEGVPLTSDELLAVALVGKILGSQPGVEYSSTKSATKLIKAASSAVSDQNFAVRIHTVLGFTCKQTSGKTCPLAGYVYFLYEMIKLLSAVFHQLIVGKVVTFIASRCIS